MFTICVCGKNILFVLKYILDILVCLFSPPELRTKLKALHLLASVLSMS